MQIYDQDGRSVDNLEWWDEDGECYEAEIRSPIGPALPGAAVAEVTEDGVADEDPRETDEAADPEENAEPTAEPTAQPPGEPTSESAAEPTAEPTVTPTKWPDTGDDELAD